MEILRPWWPALLVFAFLIAARYVGWLRWRRRVLVRRRGWGTPLEPYALALSAGNELFVSDSLKSVYVGDTHNERIAVYTTAGRFLSEYKDSAFGRPCWMVVDPKTRHLFVASYPSQSVGVFDLVWK